MTAPMQAAPPQGFFASLFDTSFKSFVTPSVIKVVYVISMVLIGLLTLGYILVGFVALHAVGIIFLFISPLVGLLYLVSVRISLEIVMVIFKIGSDVTAMRGDL